MADIDRIYEALRNADAAGDTAAASQLAQALRVAISEAPRQERRAQIQAQSPSEYDPTSSEYRAKYNPTGGTGSNLAAGAGKAYADTWRGIKQLTGNMSREEMDEVRRLDAPLMDTKAGIVGNIGGHIATSLPTAAIPGANTYKGAALIGAGLGFMQPVATGEDRLTNTAFGAAGGLGGRYLGGKVSDWASRALANSANRKAAESSARALAVGGDSGAEAGLTGSVNVAGRGGGYTFGTVGDDASAGLNKPMRQILDRGREMGFKATPGQASGSRALQQLEAKLESQPMTSGPFNQIKADNAQLLATKVADAIGVKSKTLDSATLDKAFTRLSDIFDDAADDVARQIDPSDFLQKFATVQEELRGVSKGFSSHDLVGDLIEHARNGTATGKQLQTLTSKLGKAAYKEMTTPSGDRDLGLGLYAMKDYVDDLLQQGMNGKRLNQFQEARTQYRNLMNVTSRVGAINPSTGIPSGKTLANILQQKDKSGFLRGKNKSDFYDAVRFAQAFGPIVGDSGTATRMPLSGAFDFMVRIPYNIAARAYTNPLTVDLAANAGAAGQSASGALAKSLGTAPFYAPFVFPGILGSQFPELGKQ
jgi:hypothetical protein